MDFLQLPKIELHLHLDCSLSYEVVQQIDPSVSYEAWLRDFVAPAKCTDLADYISRAVNGISLMQSRENLRLVVHDLFRQLKEDNVVYAEIRFAPLQHLAGGMTTRQVVQAVNDATMDAINNTGIEAGIILCTLRHYSETQSMETVRLVKNFEGSRVAGFDIAADEAGFPVTAHVKAFRFAKENGIPCTAHAGEAKGAESVWETLEMFRPHRIGHGVRSAEDAALLHHLRELDIHLEVCPTSNVQTNVFETMENHTVDFLYRQGVSLSISTDARTISPVTLTSEYNNLRAYFNWQKEQFLHCNLEAIKHAFASPETKTRLQKIIVDAYGPA